MTKSKSVIIGLGLLILDIICNLCWAMNNYGIKEMKNLDAIILAQGTDGTTGGTGDGTTKGFGIEQSDCICYVRGKANGYVSLGGLRVKCNAEGIAEFRYKNAQTLCVNTGKYTTCEQLTCGKFYLSLGTPTVE